MAELTLKPQEIESVPNGIFLKVDGICDVTSEDMLKDQLEKLVKSGYARFIIDLAGLKFLNSNGFAQLVALADKLKQIGGKLVLNAVPKDIAEMSQFLGLSEFFSFSENYNHGVAILLGVKPGGSTRMTAVTKSQSVSLSSIGLPSAPSSKESTKKNITKKMANVRKQTGVNDKDIARFAVIQLTRKVDLNKHYPTKVIICKEEDVEKLTKHNIDAVKSEVEFTIPAGNPYVTVFPKFPGCQINPKHTNLDISLGTIEYTFWVQPTDEEEVGDASIQVWYGNELLTALKTSLTLEQL